MSIQDRGARGVNNPAWKGDDASYSALHHWMNKRYPRIGRCEWCASTERRTEYAMARPGAKRNRADWLELCRYCHRAFDGCTEEERRRRQLVNIGRSPSLETRAKLSEALKGRRRDPRLVVRSGRARKGRAVPNETRAKISASLKGRKLPPRSAEHSAKLAAAKRAYWAARRAGP